ncbi:methionine adenosyltransferase [Mediterraneibacter faecis]|uniref:methionine adenosyltransferase n=1 Tax=Mediterraneibacter faecis TaxID=592978 RepID=UPI001D032CBC|nr:methionine adenosyltransferase [Mediterraneibacter faecis]MCB5371909.1 methionine adenosyltransferase [Mediterraneibacter faecis]MCB6850576.1 methionine adenosyltransferase [bacterium TM473]
MKYNEKTYTVESVLRGHPDKICDQISDVILDAYLEKDKMAHTAIECLGTRNKLIVAGEIKSSEEIEIESLSRKTYCEITGTSDIEVINLTSKQSEQLGNAIKVGGAGDQGVMYGYACKTEYNYLPYGYWLVNDIAKRLDELREKTKIFLPDGKVQAVVEKGKLKRVTVSVQHPLKCNMEELEKAIKKVINLDGAVVDVNTDKYFIKGGINNDTGLTGRKIIVDTYGGLAPHGGGAFSGKDPTKVDRSAAYMCRYIAKSLVANDFATECQVAVSYNFGEYRPAMIAVTADGEYSEKITRFVKSKFDFSPNSIIERLNLRFTKYYPTSRYGHFTDPKYEWEKICEL